MVFVCCRAPDYQRIDFLKQTLRVTYGDSRDVERNEPQSLEANVMMPHPHLTLVSTRRGLFVAKSIFKDGTNAQVLYPHERDLKVVTAQVPSGLIHYTSIVANKSLNPRIADAPREYRPMMQGRGSKTRREAMMELLEETEKRVAREVLKKG
ncbi:hypothetical protein LTR28_003181, partial [Elasticomyces elasticus]